MALQAVGTTVGFSESEWTDDEKNVRVSYKLAVSTGDSTEEISVPEDLLKDLGHDKVRKLRMFGVPVRCSLKTGAFGDGRGGAKLSLRLLRIEFLRLADLAALGYEAEFYDEGDEASVPESIFGGSNGSLASTAG